MNPRNYAYYYLVAAIKAFLLDLDQGDQFEPTAEDRAFAEVLHDTLAKVPVKWEGFGQP